MKERADRLLVARGLAETCEKAQALIMAGRIFSGLERIDKAGRMMETEAEILVKESLPFVSRAGAKLRQALDAFGLDPAGKIVADIGSSTGGFTDCFLQRGARRVYAVDVDTKQLDWKLRRDERVVMIEKNARFLTPQDFAEKPEMAAMDVSFISILKILPALKLVLDGGTLVALIKPQFEAGRTQVGLKGIVRDPAVHAHVLERVIRGAEEAGFVLLALERSSTRGRTGNLEFLAHFSGRNAARGRRAPDDLIKEVMAHE